MQLNDTKCLQMVCRLKICYQFISTMPKLRNTKSRTGQFYEGHTACMRAWECLVWIGIACVRCQEAIGIRLNSWKCLQPWFRSQAFLWFFQLLFCLYQWFLILIFVPFACLCIVHWIRVAFVVQIFPHWWLHIWFDSSIKAFQTWPKSHLFVPNAFDTNLIAMIAVFGA